jgi:hypothetical protein
MSRREWRCRNRECGAVLGQLVAGEALQLAADVQAVRALLALGRADITCPACGTRRSFRGQELRTGQRH